MILTTIPGTVVGSKSAQLSVRNIQMPLEHHANYLAKWNHYLFGKGASGLPGFYENAKEAVVPSNEVETYMWAKTRGEVPAGKDDNGQYWVELAAPTKPGVDYYDLACFVITESAKYTSASKAGSAVSKSINRIKSPGEDFGINGGNWKLDEANVSYDGKYWIGTNVYTRSGDDQGWDEDLYS